MKAWKIILRDAAILFGGLFVVGFIGVGMSLWLSKWLRTLIAMALMCFFASCWAYMLFGGLIKKKEEKDSEKE